MKNPIKEKRKSIRKFVANTGELTHGTSRKFTLRCHGSTLEAMLINHEGDFFAYINRCHHIALSLDWVDNQFFTEDKHYLICANHGATYEPKTGECVWGPCAGASLQSVPLEIENGNIFARCPELDEESHL
jgi:nitrite reductase/ring-hydroxylating ferredoxin subunit